MGGPALVVGDPARRRCHRCTARHAKRRPEVPLPSCVEIRVRAPCVHGCSRRSRCRS